MKPKPAVAVIGAFLVVICAVASVNVLVGDAGKLEVLFDTCLTGRAYRLCMFREAWADWPSLRFGAALNDQAGFTVGLLAGVIFLACRFRYHKSYTFAGALCLLSTSIPYAVGAVALHQGFVQVWEECGPWLAYMILTVLYGGVVCMLLASIDWYGSLRFEEQLRRGLRRINPQRLRRSWREQERVRQGLCVACGYDLRATPSRCPECGHGNTPAGGQRPPDASVQNMASMNPEASGGH